MHQESEMENAEERKISSSIDRDTFRKVVRQRQRMKAELRELKDRVSALPQDWEERLPNWLERDNESGGQVAEQENSEEVQEDEGGNQVTASPGDGDSGPGAVGEVEAASDPAEPVENPEVLALDWGAREKEYQRIIAELTLEAMIRQAAHALGAYDTQDVVDLTRNLFAVEYRDGAVKISPSPSLGQAGFNSNTLEEKEELSLEGVIEKFLQGKPHLVAAGFRPGSGLVSPPRNIISTRDGAGEDQARARLVERLRLQNRID